MSNEQKLINVNAKSKMHFRWRFICFSFASCVDCRCESKTRHIFSCVEMFQLFHCTETDIHNAGNMCLNEWLVYIFNILHSITWQRFLASQILKLVDIDNLRWSKCWSTWWKVKRIHSQVPTDMISVQLFWKRIYHRPYKNPRFTSNKMNAKHKTRFRWRFIIFASSD